MKKIIFITLFMASIVGAFAQVDSSYFTQIDSVWYQITADYDDNGRLLNRSQNIVGQTGDSAEVSNLARVSPINIAQSWGASAAQAINGLVFTRNVIREYGGLWEQVTGAGTGGYVTERSDIFASQYLENADSLGRKKCRLFLLGENKGDFYLTQLGNKRMRLTSVSNPAVFYAFVPWSQNSFQVVGVPVSDEALVAKRLNELKASNPGIATQLDEAIAALGNLNANPVLVFTGEVVRDIRGEQRKFPTYNDLEGRVRLVFIE